MLPSAPYQGFYWANAKVESEIIGIKTFFLYNNKTILSGGWINSIVEPKKDIVFVNRNMNNGMSKKIKSKWGAFRIYDKKIEFEKWEPSSGGPMKTVIRQGDILNDTTFVIRKRINNYDGKTYLVQDTFRFRQFSPKPDSTNRFVK